MERGAQFQKALHNMGLKIHVDVVVPDGGLILADLEAKIVALAFGVGEKAKAKLIEPTKTWEHDPGILLKTEKGIDFAGWTITSDDPIYGWQDQGTDPYEIKAKNANFLSFSAPHKIKTVGFKSNSSFDGKGSFAVKKVQHPGLIAQDYTGDAMDEVDRAVSEMLNNLF